MCGLASPPVSQPSEEILDMQEARLLFRKLRAAEAALEEERVLSSREREAVTTRLQFVEQQDEAARERLLQTLTSMRAQQRSQQGAQCAVEVVDARMLRERCELLKERVRGYQGEAQCSAREAREALLEVQQALAVQARLSAALQEKDAERAAAQLEVDRLASALQEHHEGSARREGAACSELAEVSAERDHLAGAVAQLRQECDALQQHRQRSEALEAEKAALGCDQERLTSALAELRQECGALSEDTARSESLEVEKTELRRDRDQLSAALAELREEHSAQRQATEQCQTLQAEVVELKKSELSCQARHDEQVAELLEAREAALAAAELAERRERGLLAKLQSLRGPNEEPTSATANASPFSDGSLLTLDGSSSIRMPLDDAPSQMCGQSALSAPAGQSPASRAAPTPGSLQDFSARRSAADTRSELSVGTRELVQRLTFPDADHVGRAAGAVQPRPRSTAGLLGRPTAAATSPDVRGVLPWSPGEGSQPSSAGRSSERHNSRERRGGMTAAVLDAERRCTEWEAAASEARAGHRAALAELAQSEEKRRETLRCMDSLLGDTEALTSSLSEHQHLAKNLNFMIQKHEESAQQALTPARMDTLLSNTPSSVAYSYGSHNPKRLSLTSHTPVAREPLARDLSKDLDSVTQRRDESFEDHLRSSPWDGLRRLNASSRAHWSSYTR